MASAPITSRNWTAENLPAGLSMSSAGKITGRPTAAGIYDVPVTVRTNWGETTKNIKIEVEGEDWELLTRKVTSYNIQKPLIETSNELGSIFVAGVDSNYYKRYIYFDQINASNQIIYQYQGGGYDTANVYMTGILGCVDTNSNDCYILGQNSKGYIVYLYAQSAKTIKSPFTSSVKWVAGAFNNDKKYLLIIRNNGYVVKVNDTDTTSPTAETTYSQLGFAPNNDCAAYCKSRQLFCVTGAGNKCAVSLDDGSTWTTGTTPDNLLELHYREDLGLFLARGESSKVYYASEDGLNWEQYSVVQIPLQTITQVGFSKYNTASYGYCAIGTRDDGQKCYSYHSKDLNNWIKKKITNGGSYPASVAFWGYYKAFIANIGNYFWLIRCNTIFDE